MINPVHKVKHRIVFADGTPPHWTIDAFSGWLATGINDCKGREIFEGDKVVFGELEKQGVITFTVGSFGISFEQDGKYLFCPLRQTKGFIDVEVIGHITEEEIS